MDRRPVVDDAVGTEERVMDPDYATAEARSKNRDGLNVGINKRTGTKSSAYWIDVLNAAGVPCGPILFDRPGIR
jgi:formyl-CoA transferase